MCFSSDSHAKRIAQLLAEAAGRRRPRYFVVRAWGRLAQIRASGVLVKFGRAHRIHHRGHARWPTSTADAFDTRYGGKLVVPRRLPGKNGAPKVKLASARSG